jgi:hypothetical protein
MNKEYIGGKIYKIVDNTNNNIYIGSTTQTILKRLQNHKRNYENYLNDKYHYVTSFEIIKNNDYKIELLEDCNVLKTKKEVGKREKHYILTLDCVNKQIPTRTKKEYYEDNKEAIEAKKKVYYEANKEKIAEYKAKWAQENKDKIREKNRKWDLENKDKSDASKRKYYEANREVINERARQKRLAKKLQKQSTTILDV